MELVTEERTMHSVVIEKPGQLVIQQRPLPQPAANEVRVKIMAITLSLATRASSGMSFLASLTKWGAMSIHNASGNALRSIRSSVAGIATLAL